MHAQDRVWSRYSSDKVDIAHVLAGVIRMLHASAPLGRPLSALSIGSSNEPQFRILESMFRGGLYLLDLEESALAIVEERIRRQGTDQVHPILGDYRTLLGDAAHARRFRRRHLAGRRMTLVTLHHSLYYCAAAAWPELLAGLVREVLARGRGGPAAIHAVLMASRSRDPHSTTWLYDHFAGRHFGAHNDQDLRAVARTLRRDRRFAGARIDCRTSRVHFFVDDFEQFMGVMWMILLHPNVHRFTLEQQREVIEHVYRHLWSRGVPLVQEQHHLVIYRARVPGPA